MIANHTSVRQKIHIFILLIVLVVISAGCMGRLYFVHTSRAQGHQKLYDQIIIMPMAEYSDGMRLYTSKKYWDAAFAFGRALAIYPKSPENEDRLYYLGCSFGFLRLDSLAEQVFTMWIQKYGNGPKLPDVLFGLMNVNYRSGLDSAALSTYARIVVLGETPVRYSADCLAGQIYFRQGDYDAAEELLQGIPSSSAEYPVAQYALASVYTVRGQSSPAQTALARIVADTAAPDSIVDAAYLKMGHLYFEEDELRNAVNAYQHVPEGSPEADEAKLGIAYCWLRVNQGGYCVQEAMKLLFTSPHSPYSPEAALLAGYGYAMMRKHDDAKRLAKQCISGLSADSFDTLELVKIRDSLSMRVARFAPFAREIFTNCFTHPTNATVERRKSLYEEFELFAHDNRRLFECELEIQKRTKYLKNRASLLEKAEQLLRTGSPVKP
jgi:TolA-binding protein